MITLYSTGCPQCLVLEKMLKDKNIDFEICQNIETMTEMGIMSVPVLETEEGTLLNFKSALDWTNKIESRKKDTVNA